MKNGFTQNMQHYLSAHVDATFPTHVDLLLASSGTAWTDAVVKGQTGLGITGRPMTLKDGTDYHLWVGPTDTVLNHYVSKDPSFSGAVSVETTYDTKPFEVSSIAIVKEGDTFYMIAYGADNQKFAIYNSDDGTSWLNKGMIFDATGKISGGKVDAPAILLDGAGSKIYFQYEVLGVRSIYMIETSQALSAIADANDDEDYSYTASDNPVLQPTESGLSSTRLFHPFVVKDGGTYYMWYTAYSPDYRVRLATSADGKVWTFNKPNPVLTNHSAEPSVIKDGDIWRMYYQGNSGVAVVTSKQLPGFNETITYTVKANLTNVNGMDFYLVYPAELTFISAADNGLFSSEVITHNASTRTINFRAYQLNANETAVDYDLLKINFAGKTAGVDKPMDLVLASGFTTFPIDNVYTSEKVYDMGLVDGTVTVFDLPTLTSTYTDDYYVVGDAWPFTVTVTNTTGTFTDTELQLTVPTGLALTLDGSTYTLAGGVVDLGELAPDETIVLTFNATFASVVTEPLIIDLVDTTAAFELATYGGQAVVYTKPTLTESSLTGDYQGVTVDFTITVGNLSELVDDYPITYLLDMGVLTAGTEVIYDGITYTCDALVACQIPVTLTAPSTVLDLSIVFPGSFQGDITASLYDDRDTDRLLATQTFTDVFVVPNVASVTGKITLQGRTDHSGADMILTAADGFPYGPHTATSTTDIGANLHWTNIAGTTYTVITFMPRYLNIPATMAKTIDVLSDTAISPLWLRGGNAVWSDNVIDGGDSGKIGTDWGTAGTLDGQSHGDVNFDGIVDIRDLALVGGNYLLTSEDAYAETIWMP